MWYSITCFLCCRISASAEGALAEIDTYLLEVSGWACSTVLGNLDAQQLLLRLLLTKTSIPSIFVCFNCCYRTSIVVLPYLYFSALGTWLPSSRRVKFFSLLERSNWLSTREGGESSQDTR